MAARHSLASGWSTSSSRVLSDWTMRGPSLTQQILRSGGQAQTCAGLSTVTPGSGRSFRLGTGCSTCRDDLPPAGGPGRRIWPPPAGGGSAAAESQVGEGPVWLDHEAQRPHHLGATDVRRGTPGEVGERGSRDPQLGHPADDDGDLLGPGEIAPALLGGHTTTLEVLRFPSTCSAHSQGATGSAVDMAARRLEESRAPATIQNGGASSNGGVSGGSGPAGGAGGRVRMPGGRVVRVTPDGVVTCRVPSGSMRNRQPGAKSKDPRAPHHSQARGGILYGGRWARTWSRSAQPTRCPQLGDPAAP